MRLVAGCRATGQCICAFRRARIISGPCKKPVFNVNLIRNLVFNYKEYMADESKKIHCPSCGHVFDAADAFREEVQRELNAKARDWQEKKEEEYRKREDALQKQLNEAFSLQKKMLEENIRKSVTGDYENKLKLLAEANQENEEKLKTARQKELEFLKKEQELKTMKEEFQITLEKKLLEEREQLSEKIRKQEQEKLTLKENETQLRMKELEKQLEDQKKLVEEMKRRAEQGSMQLQGEVQELAIEEWLKAHFPFDAITEVKKGVRGGDCIQIVNTHARQNCGAIYYESKRTKEFSRDWIEKFKADMRAKGARMGILVTEAFPKEMTRMGQKDGIWICSFEEFKGLCFVLRETVILLSEAEAAHENKGDKMAMLYQYLTGNEFRMQVEAIVEGFSEMNNDLAREKRAMEGIWKKREKQIQKVLTNTTHMYSSIKGIAGNAIGDIRALELPGAEEIGPSENQPEV